jgi:hypothetical protein
LRYCVFGVAIGTGTSPIAHSRQTGALAMRVDVLRVVIPGLGLIAIAALARTEAWPAWMILFDTIVLEFLFGVMLANGLYGAFACRQQLRDFLSSSGSGLILIVPMISENARVLTRGIPAFATVAGDVPLDRLSRPHCHVGC